MATTKITSNVLAANAAQNNINSNGSFTLSVPTQINNTLTTNSSVSVGGNLTVDTDTLFVDAANNKVGVGTTAPNEKLQVTNGNIGTFGDGNGFVTYNLGQGNYSGNYEMARFMPVSNEFLFQTLQGGTGVGRNLRFVIGNANLTFVNSSGNIGIGTTTPNEKLTVVGNISATGNLTVDTNTLFVDSVNNRVGIGTITPTQTLDVSGNINVPTTTSTVGAYMINGTRFAHNYGSSNTFIGTGAGNTSFNTTYNGANVGIGTNALSNLNGTSGQQGSFNFGLGASAGSGITTGSSNILIGNSVGTSITTTSYNTIIGDAAGLGATGLTGVVYLGRGAGRGISTFTDSIFLGTVSGGTTDGGLQTVSGLTNAVAIGARSFVGASHTIVLGSVGAYATDIVSGGSVASAKLHLIKTTEQLRLGYDASNYTSLTVSSAGNVTRNNTGTFDSQTLSGNQALYQGFSSSAVYMTIGGTTRGDSSVGKFNIFGTGTSSDSPIQVIWHTTDDSAAKNAGLITKTRMGSRYLKTYQTIGQNDNSFGNAGLVQFTAFEYSNNTYTTLATPTEFSGWNYQYYNGAAYESLLAVRKAGVGVGVVSPNAAAKLQVDSTTQGFLPPRMTTVQRDAITSVPAGLMVYNTTTNKLNFYNGSAWEAVTSA